MPEMYDDDEATQFDPSPWGSRQRVLPRHTFRAAPSIQVTTPPAAPPMIAAVAIREQDSLTREQDILTERVARYPMKPRARIALRPWVPLGAFVATAILAFAFARPAPASVETCAISGAIADEATESSIHIVTNIEQPPQATQAIEPARLPAIKPKLKVARHVVRRARLAFDTSTPLGDLARSSRR